MEAQGEETKELKPQPEAQGVMQTINRTIGSFSDAARAAGDAIYVGASATATFLEPAVHAAGEAIVAATKTAKSAASAVVGGGATAASAAPEPEIHDLEGKPCEPEFPKV